MAVPGTKRKFVIAPEGYHPVKVAKCAKSRLAGEHVSLGTTGAGCAIDDVYAGDEASFQTRGLVSIGIPSANANVGDFLYAVRSSSDDDSEIQLVTHNALVEDNKNPSQVRPWGIILQRGPIDFQQECTVRVFKFPGPFVVQTLVL